ncbi:MAG: AgmX/PglI C-terminal domain-containing protein [Myxococcota bacterium]
MIEEADERHGQDLRDELQRARGDLETTVASLREVDARLEDLETERARFVHLETVCASLEQLDALGAADLFWRAMPADVDAARHLEQVRSRIDAFEKEVASIESRREEILDEIERKQDEADWVAGEILELERKVEERQNEWEIERDPGPIAIRASIMPWARGGEDDARFRRTLATSLAVSLLIGLLLPLIDLPIPDRWEVLDEQDRLTQLIREERVEIPQAVPIREPEPTSPLEAEPVAPSESPTVAEQAAPESASSPAAKKRDIASSGLLAFSEQLSGLADTNTADRLGSNARITDDRRSASDLPARAVVASRAAGSSGGINVAELSRGSGGTGDRLTGVAIERATSSIGTGGGNGDRPLAGGGPSGSRTDEEIQIVFDRHKSALYRLYNRALRSNPTLRGQIVLRMTIEPDGSVSLCEIKSTDMKAPELARRVVERVKTFDFGAKEGIPPVTIVYPIDFLPAS